MTTENWGEEFRKLWGVDRGGDYWNDPECSALQMHDFISTLLSKERNEAYEKGFTTGRQGIIDNVYTSGEEMISEFRRRHPHHMGEAGGYCLMCACIDALDKVRKEAMKLNYWDKEKRNEVLDEVKEEVEKNRGGFYEDSECGYALSIIENLKVK
jgi:hypothetical protein